MTLAHHKSLLLLALLALPSFAAGCAAAEPDATDGANLAQDDVGTSESAALLKQSPILRPGGPGTIGPIGPIGPEPTPKVTAPAYVDGASIRTATQAGVGWYELAVNPTTKIFRQKFDLDDHAVGPATLIKTFSSLPKGDHGFADTAMNTDDHSGPDTDRKNCYQIVESAGDCSVFGNCVNTAWVCSYTRAATAHPISRAQIRLHLGTQGSAAGTGDHVQVRLQSPYYPYVVMPQPRGNSTWLDSTRVDFGAGSDLTYDVKLNNVSDLSDINQITIANNDGDSLCIHEIELIADNRTAFFKSFGPLPTDCAEAVNSGDLLNGKQVSVQFGELRRNFQWMSFNPPNLGTAAHPATFAGYDGPGLISFLDSLTADSLRDPANGRGAGAGFQDGHATTATAVNSRTLHVQQHIVAQDVGWNGEVDADPSFDLVIHDHDPVCGSRPWCVKVENVNANSSFSGWSQLIPVIGAVIQYEVDSEADGQIGHAMSSMAGIGLSEPPMGTQFCFVSKAPNMPTPIFSGLFGAGSFTLCGL